MNTERIKRHENGTDGKDNLTTGRFPIVFMVMQRIGCDIAESTSYSARVGVVNIFHLRNFRTLLVIY